MTRLTKQAAQRLAEFVHLVGGEWNTPGILAALEKSAPTANAWDIAHALLRIAEDPTVKTPAMLNQPGTHWQRPDGSRIERRGDHNQPCTVTGHEGEVHPCPKCRTERYVPTEDDKRAWREELAKAEHRKAAERAHVEEARAAASDTHQRRGGGPHPAERPAAACPTPNHDDQEATA